jgi:hypothetical protein
VAEILAMSDGRRLVGNRAERKATAADQRKCRRRRENSFSHEYPPSRLERCYRAGVETQPGRDAVLDSVEPCCPTTTDNFSITSYATLMRIAPRSSLPYETVPRKPHVRILQ